MEKESRINDTGERIQIESGGTVKTGKEKK